MQKLPTKLYRSNQVREIDRIAIEDLNISGFELMTRAGLEIAECIKEQYTDTFACAVFCGAGNNGGDGYVVAQELMEAGIQVTVYSVVETHKLKDDALRAREEFIKADGQLVKITKDTAIKEDLIIDALLGTGLDRPVTGLYAEAIALINKSPGVVVAVDIPSGLNANTGKVMGCAVKAHCTMTFLGLKQGLFTGDAAEYCGTIKFSSLDIPENVTENILSSARRFEFDPLSKRPACAHKGYFGHVLIVGGELGFSGAVRMAGESALRTGAGLVSIATRHEHAHVINLSRPELMCHGIDHAEQLSGLIEKITILVLGPGLGTTEWSRMLFNTASQVEIPVILDADALNLLAETHHKKENWILTPHPGEAARLLQKTVIEVEQDRFASVRAIQQKFGGICVLKGAGTLIANDSDIAVSSTGNPGMASAGMGDVLTGVIAGLTAQGFSNSDAAEKGVYLHGMAADIAAEAGGMRGLIATDLMAHIRSLVN